MQRRASNGGRPQWRVVRGGSSSCVQALRAHWPVRERLNCAVRAIRRHADGAVLDSDAGAEHFDQVVLACHSDQALRLLCDADARERSILGAMPYQAHAARTLLPASISIVQQYSLRSRAWSPSMKFPPCNGPSPYAVYRTEAPRPNCQFI